VRVGEWEVEFTDEFETWWNGLTAEEQESVAFYVGLLEARGVALDHPYSSKVARSRHSRMRELRIQHAGPIEWFMRSTPGGLRSCSSAATRPETIAGTRSTCLSPMRCTTRILKR
jgi:hypothetical protein